MEVYSYQIQDGQVAPIPANELTIQVLYEDLWLRRGISVFTTFIAKNGRPFHVERHLERLRDGCIEAAVDCPPVALDFLTQEVERLAAEQPGNWKIEITVTPGSAADTWRPDGPGHLFLARKPLVVKNDLLGDPSTVKTVAFGRAHALVKDRIYRQAWTEFQKMQKKGEPYDDILYCVEDEMLELSRSNIFFVKNGVLYTPSTSKVLPGVTRGVVIELARNAGYEVVDTQPILLSQLAEYSEAFATGSISGVRAVIRINDRIFAEYPVTEAIARLFREYEKEYFGVAHA